MRKALISCLCLCFAFGAQYSYAQEVDLDAEVAKTSSESLPISPSKIIVRGYDGENPPPSLNPPKRPLFYGYGVTAYYMTTDTLMFFKVLKFEAEHMSKEGDVLAHFNLTGSRYNDAFKSYFLNAIEPAEKKNIYFRNIYLKDKKGNYFKLEKEFAFCPHCQ